MITLIIGILAFAGGASFTRLLSKSNKKKTPSLLEDHSIQIISDSGDAHPIKCKVSPVTPHEALTLESTDVTRLEYLIGWVNGQLCKLNNEERSVALQFPIAQQNRKTVDAVKDIFSANGWEVKEVTARDSYGYEIKSRIDLKFSTDEKVRVTLDDPSNNNVRVEVKEVDELEQKFVDLEKKINAAEVVKPSSVSKKK